MRRPESVRTARQTLPRQRRACKHAIHAQIQPAVIPLYVAVGGGLGALARFALGQWLAGLAGTALPWGTLAVNVTGCLLIGFFGRALPSSTASPSARAFLMIGLCGGFTTFSAFDYETLRLLEQGRFVPAAAYSSGTVLACIAGVTAGMSIASVWLQRRPAGP
jgi:CrcB protein